MTRADVGSNVTKLIVEPLPLSEGSSIDNDNSVLNESLGSDQLVIGGIVDDVDDPGLPGDGFTRPREVALVEPECPVLLVASSHPEGVDPLGGHLGHGGRPGQLELPLLADGSLLATSGAALMPVISRDTHGNVLLAGTLTIT